MSATELRATVSAQQPRRPRPPLRDGLRRVPPDVWALVGLTVLAAALRFATIAGQSYWADESLTVHEVRQGFGAMLATVTKTETTPPLYFILAWAWAHVVGSGEAALRSLSALAGVAVVPIAYLCGRDLVSRRAGLIAAAFAALNPFLIWYSQEARSYMLLMAFTAASFLWFIRAEREPSRRHIVWWAIFSALALATHFFAGFLVAPEALWLLWRARSREAVFAVGALAAVQVALVPLAADDTSHGIGWIHNTPIVTRISQVATEFAVSNVYRHVTVSQGLWGGAIVTVIAVLLLALVGGRVERRGALMAGAIGATVIVVPLVLGLVRPADDFFLVRNLSPAWIPISVALAAACAAPRARDVGMVAATLLLVLFAFGTIEIDIDPAFQRADWRGVAHALGPATGTRAILIAGGQSAIPLKIFLDGVSWVQPPQTRRLVIDQVAVVGSIAWARIRGQPPSHRGRALPRYNARGAAFLGHSWVRNFDIARYDLLAPVRLDTRQLAVRAGRFFRHTPANLLVLVQRGAPAAAPVPLAPGRPGPLPPARPRGVRAHHRSGRPGGAHSGARRRAHGPGIHVRRRSTRPPHRLSAGGGAATEARLPLQVVPSRGCWKEVQPAAALPREYACLRVRSRSRLPGR